MIKEKLDMNEFFAELMRFHGLPAYITICINKDRTIDLLSVASTNSNMRHILDLKMEADLRNYFG